MNILLSYEIIPEENKSVLILDADEDTIRKLKLINNTVQNANKLTEEQEKIHDEINSHLSPNPKYGDCLWDNFALDPKSVVEIPPNTIYIRAGFYL